MADEYYYIPLSADEIKRRLISLVRYDEHQELTKAEKACARENIGAAQGDSRFRIISHFDTLEDLADEITNPIAGDAYSIGNVIPYNIYIYDGIHNQWVDHGPLYINSELIEDDDTVLDKTWSSHKISVSLLNVSDSKQDKIESGDISTSMLAPESVTRDKLAIGTLYGPVKEVGTNYTIRHPLPSDDEPEESDIGKILYATQDNTTIVLDAIRSEAMPIGAEIGIVAGKINGDPECTIRLPTNEGRISLGNVAITCTTVRLNGGYTMCVIKKFANGVWMIMGNVNVMDSEVNAP